MPRVAVVSRSSLLLVLVAVVRLDGLPLLIRDSGDPEGV